MKIIKKIMLLILFVFVVLAFLEIIPVAPKYKDENPWLISDGQHPIVGLSVGDDTVYPENTIYTFEQLASSSDIFNVELRLTGDDQLITSRDASIKRLTNVDETIRDVSETELIKYNYAVNFENVDGVKAFADLTDESTLYEKMVPANLEYLFQAYPNKEFILEIRDTDDTVYKHAVDKLTDLINTYNMKDQVIVSTDVSKVRDYHAPYNESVTSLPAKESIKFLSLNLMYLDFFYTPKDAVLILSYNEPLNEEEIKYLDKLPDFLKTRLVNDNGNGIIYSNFVNKNIIKEAHRHNVAVYVSGVEDEDVMRSLIQMGVDGIITNKPEQLSEIIDSIN